MKNILRGVVVLFAVLTAAPVWAQTVSTTYIDENGTSHTVTAKVLTDTTGTFTSDTWYVVNSNVVRNSTIGYEGNIKLIIADGKTLDISGCLGVNGTTSISIYGQTRGTGKLSVYNESYTFLASGSINITGCIVEATSDNNHAIICGIGGSTGNITINGGQVTALGGVGKGLSATGTITLGYRKKTDYISAKGFRGTVNIKSGQTLYNGATAYSGNDVGLTGSATLRPFSSNDLSINNTGTEYTIYSATGWNLFCDFLNDNDTYNRFSGKTVRLGANITVTRMAGSDYHDFCGIFDGQGHTITLDGNTTNGCYALFRNVSTGRANSTDTEDTPSAIRNLHVTGTIITASKYAAGFISGKYGNVTIENCRSSVIIKSSVGGDGTHGGFVAVNNSYQLTITGCVFDGKLLTTGTTATTYCAGFVGWNESSVNISNSLYAPTNILTGETEISSECTFVRGTTPTLTNCYYTRTLGTAQGKQPRSINAGQYVTLTGVNPVGNGTTYSVSGLTAYSGGGLGHGNAFYYGVGDNVSLTLSHSNCTGYTFNNYMVTGGSIDGNTVTMPDTDVTIGANLFAIDWATVNEGTEADPYMIYNKDQLNLLAYRTNGTHGEDLQSDGYSGKYFKLGDDITYPYTTAWNDATSTENNYEAIGGIHNGQELHFDGHFDGDNHTISGIRIYKGGDGVGDKNQGVFGWLTNATVRNITLADTRITAEYYTGGIAGSNFAETGHIGSISNCHVAANVLIHTDQNGIQWHGGIVGRNANGQIDHCTSAATLAIADGVNGGSAHGAIVGHNDGDMTYNLAIGAVIPAISQHGAICGYHSLSQFIEKNYYYNCTVAGVENASGVGCDGADNNDYWESAVSIHLLTLGDNVTTTTPFTFTYNETGYYKHTATVELGCTLDVPNDYSVVYTTTTADGTDVTATAINGSTLTMPAADVTVTANLYYNLNIPAGTWQAISTPMHDEGGDYESIANVDGLTDGSYDFFRYDEGTSTWENQKIYSDFALEIGNGYLYRCSEAKTLTYHGEPNMAASYSVALSASGNSDLNGFNLVGNPYNYGITLEIPFYSINADGSWTAHNANETIAMGQAVIVHTNQDVDLIFEAAGKRAYLSNPAAKGPLPALPAMLNLENRNSIFEIQNSESLSTLFAYQNGDQLVITATGTLQAFDVMGRLLFSREVPGSKCEIPTLNFPSAGVYVLRLDGKSQKIVIN